MTQDSAYPGSIFKGRFLDCNGGANTERCGPGNVSTISSHCRLSVGTFGVMEHSTLEQSVRGVCYFVPFA